MSEHLSLLELNKLVQHALAKNLEPSYWVVAEIGELRVNNNGHCYLELVEKNEDKVLAKSRATIWAYTYNNLSLWFEKMTGERLKHGLKILCNVVVQYHEIYGLSFNIKDIDANYTLGEKERKRQETIAQLTDDGIIDLNKSLKLPRVITKVAVISSPAAAGYEDFMNQLVNNSYGYAFETSLFKATMQGDAAVESIINALHAVDNASEEFDAVLILRGGGARLDLDCFDNYELCFASAQFPLPIITGIGHERDQSIMDLIANKSVKTPTAAAEFLIGRSLDFESQLLNLFDRGAKIALNSINNHSRSLSHMQDRLISSTRMNLKNHTHKLSTLSTHLTYGTQKMLANASNQLKEMENTIHYLDPTNTLKRGYTLTTLNGKFIHTENVKEGDIIETRTVSSIFESEVLNKKEVE